MKNMISLDRGITKSMKLTLVDYFLINSYEKCWFQTPKFFIKPLF
jgi:hypothetical protein